MRYVLFTLCAIVSTSVLAQVDTPKPKTKTPIEIMQTAEARAKSASIAKSQSIAGAKSISSATTGSQNIDLEVNPTFEVSPTLEVNPKLEANSDDDIEINFDGDENPRQAPMAIAGYSNNTASCFRTYGLGGSNSTGGFSLGWPFKDGDCDLGEDAAQAFAMGNSLVAWKMYCRQWSVQKVYGFGDDGSRLRWRIQHQRRSEATELCLLDAGITDGPIITVLQTEINVLREQISSYLKALVQADSATDVNVETILMDLDVLRARVVELEGVAHPEGTGMGVKQVEKIIDRKTAGGACAPIGVICK